MKAAASESAGVLRERAPDWADGQNFVSIMRCRPELCAAAARTADWYMNVSEREMRGRAKSWRRKACSRGAGGREVRVKRRRGREGPSVVGWDGMVLWDGNGLGWACWAGAWKSVDWTDG